MNVEFSFVEKLVCLYRQYQAGRNSDFVARSPTLFLDTARPLYVKTKLAFKKKLFARAIITIAGDYDHDQHTHKCEDLQISAATTTIMLRTADVSPKLSFDSMIIPTIFSLGEEGGVYEEYI